MNTQFADLSKEEPLHIFSYKLKLILGQDELWSHIHQKKPKNPYNWLAVQAELSPSYLYRLVKNEVNISIDRAGAIAAVLGLPLWQMIKPDYEFLDVLSDADQ